MNTKKIVQLVQYSLIIMILVIGLGFTVMILMAIWLLVNPLIPKAWDFLAFCGSIIGGAITWVGVRLSIGHQRRSEKIDRIPIKINSILKLQTRLYVAGEVYGFITNSPADTVYSNIAKFLDEYYREHDQELSESAALIDGVVYSAVNKIFTHIDDFNEERATAEGKHYFDDWYNRLFELLDHIHKRLYYYENELERHTGHI